MKVSEIAAELVTARLDGKPIPPVTERLPSLDLAGAYEISRKVFEDRLSRGLKSIGRKVGLTSFAVQRQLGVDQPDFGYLTSEMKISNGGLLPAGSLIQGRAEGEIAFLLKNSLKGPGITEADVRAATEAVFPCIEIIDSRIENWKIKVQDTVADNASSAYFVLGDSPIALEKVDLRLAGMKLTRNGEIESTGVGAACLGHPVKAVAWLANQLAKLGDQLKEGDLILSGAYGPVVPFLEGDSIEVNINSLGTVKCRYESKEKI